MGERMDGWPLSRRREGRGGWREVVLEMEEKKRGDINLAEGRPARLSPSLSLSLRRPALRTQRHVCAALFTRVFVSLVRAAAPHQVRNSQE